MDEVLTTMRVVSADRERRAKRILEAEAGWDGQKPIPVKWFGGATDKDLAGIKLIHASGDDQCYWVKDAKSALVLFLKGHDLVKDPDVLAKRSTFKKKKD